ncbi:MAG: IS66 family transposase [Isosphaeraceae bacterium]
MYEPSPFNSGQLASDLFGLDLSLGMIPKLERQAAEILEPLVVEAAAAVVAAPSAHIDETSWAEANEKAWLWVGQTDDLTVFTIAGHRSADVARLILGTDKTKVVVSDRFSSYDWIEQHQYCWSHLRRDFQAMIDRRDVGSAIGTELLGSSDRLFHWWHKYRDGEMAWSTFLGYARPIRWDVRHALGRGVSCASEKTAATCRMLLEGEEHMWTFLRVRGIEPTNNAAERALRHAVLWCKSSGGTASEWGSRFVERVLSVAATCRQQGRNVLEYLTECFRAHLTGGRLPSLIPLVVHADGRRDRGIGLLALDPGLVLHVGDRRPLGIMGGGRQLDLLADGHVAAVERQFDLLSPWFSLCESQKTT